MNKEALHKLAAESLNEGLRLDDWPKIGCVNHDCDKCKALAEQPAQQEPVVLDGQRKLVEILAKNWRVWPARKAVEQTSLGDVYCSAKGRDLMFGNHEIASDQDSAVVTKEMWSTMRKALAEQPAPVQQASCLVRRLEGVADLRRIEGDHDEAAVIDEAVSVLKATPQAQPAREWVGLTKEDKAEIVAATERDDRGYVMALVEAKLMEKNT